MYVVAIILLPIVIFLFAIIAATMIVNVVDADAVNQRIICTMMKHLATGIVTIVGQNFLNDYLKSLKIFDTIFIENEERNDSCWRKALWLKKL